MKANPLVIALVVLVALGGAVWYTTENPPPADDEEKPTLIETEAEEIREIAIRRPDGSTLTVVRNGDDGWTFGGGRDIRADNSAIGLLATNLGGLQADRLVEENVTDWAPYGLASTGDLAVKMTPKEGPPVEVVFGNETPTGSGVFARIEGDPRLFTIYNYVKTGFEKSSFDLRDKKLLALDAAGIERIQVKTGATAYALAREAEKWSLAEPGPYRADDFTAGDVSRSIQNAEMTDALAEGEGDAEQYSFGRPYAEVVVTDSAGEHTLTVGKSGDEYFAKSSDQPGVYAVSATFAEGLNKSVDELRNKKLFDFGFSPVSKIEMRDGETSAVIEKREADWVLTSDGERTLDAEKVQTLIDRLRNLAAVELLPARGIGTVAIEATVTSTEEETVRLGSLSGESVNALREGEETVYKLEKAPAEDLRQALKDVLAQPTDEPAAEGAESN